MRSKSTNVLQGVVLLTGIIYIATGLFFFISPYRAFRLMAFPDETSGSAVVHESGDEGGRKIDVGGELSEDDWLKQTVNDEIISPLYYLFRIFAMLLAIGGCALIMPLFDPLRYRGLVYYHCLVFPLVAAVSSFIFMGVQRSIGSEIAAAHGRASAWSGHPVMLVLGVGFSIIFLLAAAALIITRKQAREGRE